MKMESNSRMARHLARIFMFTSSLVVVSCTDRKLQKKLDLRKGTIAKHAAILERKLSSQESTPLSWEKASKLLFSKNLQIKQSRTRFKEARKRNSKNIKQLLPSLALSSQFSGSFSALSDITSDDFRKRISTSFNIPNPIRFYGQLYQGSLEKVESEIRHEIVKRQNLIRLMLYYDQAVSLSKAEQRYQRTLKKFETLGSESLSKNLTTLKKESINLKRQKHNQRLKLNRFFNTPGAYWELSGTPPKLPYSKNSRLKNLSLGENFGGIFFNQQAIALEKAYLQVLNSRVNQIPSINLGLSSPTLYDSEQSDRQSVDQINLFGGLNKNINVNDFLDRTQIKSAKKRRELTESLILQQIEQELSNYTLLSEQISDNKKQIGFLENKLAHLESLETATAQAAVSKFKQINTLSEEINIVNERQRQLYYQILIGDDSYWQTFYKKHSYLLSPTS